MHLTLWFWPDDKNVRLFQTAYGNTSEPDLRKRQDIPWTNGMRAFALFLLLAKAGQRCQQTDDSRHWLNTLRKAREQDANPIDNLLHFGDSRFLVRIATVRGRPPGLMSVEYNESAMPFGALHVICGHRENDRDEISKTDELLNLAKRIQEQVARWRKFTLPSLTRRPSTDPLADTDLAVVPHFEVHPEPTLGAALRSYRMEMRIYGRAASWPKDVYASLWRSFRQGGQVLYRGGRPVGGIGMYPLSPGLASVIKKGQLKDAEISRLLIDCVEERPVQCWFLSTIELTPDVEGIWERSAALRFLISRGIPNALEGVKLCWPLEVLAFGSSVRGVNHLRRFRFSLLRDAEENPDRWPLFSLKVRSPGALKKLLDEVSEGP